MTRVRVAIVFLIAVLQLASCQRTEPYPPPAAGPDTDQGWDDQTARSWYHADQGTAFFPYAWLLALEQADSRELFAAPDNLRRFGFLPDAPHPSSNPDGLPVGFSRTTIAIDRPPFSCWQGEWVGFTCAACHTGELRYRGAEIRIEGGPAQNDIEAFRNNLGGALGEVSADPAKALRFIARVVKTAGPAGLDVRDSLQCFRQAAAARQRVIEEGLKAAGELPTEAGFARLDALGRGANFLFAESTRTVANYKPTTAPVSFPPLWDTPYYDWVLYNNSVRQPLARSIVEALGVGAPIDLSTLNAPVLQHDLELDNIVDIQLWLQDLKSPQWPEAVLGAIDQDLATQGGEVYRATCVGCHQIIDREAREASCAERPEFAIPSYPIDEVGTDPRQAVNFATREIMLGQQTEPLGAWVKLVTDKIVGQYMADPKNAARAELINCDAANDFQVIEEYRARPLNGFWATAPYLHNGSVPDLVELLKPAGERPATFYVGNWEFDPERLGFAWRSPSSPSDFRFDTSLTGNSNAGHEYGTDLSVEDRRALIEYLKTL
jgi:hypothetical protein